VSQRTHEIGVRMALGARARDVERLVIRQGLVLSALGLTIGIGVALAASGALSAVLYGVSATDPAVLALSAATLVLAAGLASWIPALRAARVDPMEALRDL
jgi:ABC-type antimicrobial peptide transport system permease subunit